ncbi:MAG: AAA family ATPase [Candidatus Micrarchaeota archaeon]|nr:AAA family ATPase [Candidatus Micrarchaeota archaeon]
MAGQAQGMGKQKLLATMQMMKNDDNLGAAVLVFLGTLSLLLAFPFYPVYLAPFMAGLAALVAYRQAPLGTIAGLLIVFPAVAYQAPVFAWLFTVIIAIALFEAFEHWSVISFLEVAIFAPFAIAPFSLLSGFLFLFLGIAAMRFGSRHSFVVSLPAIFIVLLLSSIWMVQTNSFITISKDSSLYGPAMPELQNNKSPVELSQVVPEAGNALMSLLDFEVSIKPVSEAINKVVSNAIALLVRDSAIIQLAVWAAALFACAYLPAQINHKHKQAIASLSLFLIPISNLLIAPSFNNPFEPMSFVYCALCVGIIAGMEHYGVSLSHERQVERKEKQKAFDKFGESSLADSGLESLDDVGGYEDVKGELREAIVAPIKNPEYAYTYGIKPPKGILLFGPPGTGKTMIMRALANELDIGFRYVKCSELLSEWYGESEKNLSEVFSIARKKAPFLLFFDEIDSIGKKRDSYTSDDVAPRVMSVLLQELDGFASNPKKPVIFVGATNLPDQLDPALMRPGRFDKIIYMHLPDLDARKAIFKVHLSKLPHDETIDYGKLASITERYSGADIKNICTESSRIAAREAMTSGVVVQITEKHILSLLKRIKPSVTLDAVENYSKFRMDFERRSDAPEKAPDQKGVRWDDVAGLEGVRQVLLEAIELPLLHEDKMKEYDIKPSKGLLLFGPPGCGKTMIVRAAANELNANFLTISGSELMQSKDKSPATFVREVFNRARESAPALVFVDEVEALAPSRDEYRGGILTELLQELDGVRELKNVMIVGATNKPSALDPAILRPGRFDKILYIPPPDAPARTQIITANLAKFLKGVNVSALASATDGFSGADLASICQEVKMRLVRSELRGKKEPITTAAVMEVIGSRRPSVTQKDLREFFSFMQEYGERK